MPSLLSRPEFLTSRRHLAAAGVGLAVVVALCGAATFAPGPAGVRPAAAAEAATGPTRAAVDPVPAGVTDDLLPAAGAARIGRPARPVGPPATVATPVPDGPAITALAAQGIPIVALEAYRRAAAVQAVERPSCHLGWPLVAAIGAIESGHGTHAGARLYADGQDLPHVLGPVLDGTHGNARIADTDKGVLDGDPAFDRAVGPMQFIPSTWKLRGRDGNGDGRADPFNIVDAAVTTGDYLCRYDVDLGTDAGRRVAVFGYNHLDSYVTSVLSLEALYADRPVVTTSPSPAAPPTTAGPTSGPSRGPSSGPSAAPTPRPTPTRTSGTPVPTPTPTCPVPPGSPTGSPGAPTGSPTGGPSGSPSGGPTGSPTGCPSPPSSTVPPRPSASPSASPSVTPTT